MLNRISSFGEEENTIHWTFRNREREYFKKTIDSDIGVDVVYKKIDQHEVVEC